MDVLLYAGGALVAVAFMLALVLNTLGVPASPATLYSVRAAAFGGFVLTLICCAYWRTVMLKAFERDRQRLRGQGLGRARIESVYLRIALGSGLLMLGAVLAYG